MAGLNQRVWLLQIRPCFVYPHAFESEFQKFPNVITKYIGPLYRMPLGAEATNIINEPVPNGYELCIKIPEINRPVQELGDFEGGGIERFNGNEVEDVKGRMPSNTDGTMMFSKGPFNEAGWYSSDFWMLHSTWISFEECKQHARYLVDLIGFDGVMISQWVNLWMEMHPTK